MAVTIARLLEEIDLANNGYIPLAYMSAEMRAVAQQAKEEGIVVITGNGKTAHGLVCRPETLPTIGNH